MDCPPSFTPSQFYGKSRKQKREQDAICKKLGQNVVKLPTAFSHRILGPTNCWRVFYRQNEAFSWARRTAEDVMVFAFENTDRDLALATGQRRYLVTSLDVFWHYYSQMDPNKRHHYEIIPEGWPCRLYFDLEFLKNVNPGSDGERMVDILIQYVCMWLQAVFNLRCDRACVLDLDASTETKFSRHLIFHIPRAVFVNCVAAGNFVRHIFGLLMKYVKLKSNELNISPAVFCQKGQGFTNCLKSQPNNCDFDEMSDEDLVAAAEICHKVISQRCNTLTVGTNGSGTNHDILIDGTNVSGTNHDVNGCVVECRTSSISSDVVPSGTDDNSRSVPKKIRMSDFSSVDFRNGNTDISSLNISSEIINNINVEEKQISKHTATSDKIEHQLAGIHDDSFTDHCSSSGENVLCGSSANEMMRICDLFSLNDLQSLLVSNSDGNKMTFSDLGVYTKNRNFRLYLSSKLNKNNPLTVAACNQFTPETTGKISPEQAMFNASLVSNVRYSSNVQILTFGSSEQDKCHTAGNPRSGNCGSTHKEDFLEGHNCLSPYPEIDSFIESLTWSHGCRGRVRHWMCFRSSDSLLYDITGCRWCGNVQREHRSNNVMYIVDLRQGTCYQKCYDPDCQAMGYRSEAMEIPSSLLPSSFCNTDWDDDDEWADDQGSSFNDDAWNDSDSNKRRLGDHHEAEKLRQGDSHKNNQSDTDEVYHVSISSFEEDDDDFLLAAAEEMELESVRLTQKPDLAGVSGRGDDHFDCDDDCDHVAMLAATEQVEMYWHQDMCSET